MIGGRRRVAGLAVLLALLTASGCGTPPRSAADQLPALTARLAGIDHAVATHRYGAARKQLSALILSTQQSRDAGGLDASAAERVLAAAAGLFSSLQVDTPSAAPTHTAAPPKPTAIVAPAAKPQKNDKGHAGHGEHHDH